MLGGSAKNETEIRQMISTMQANTLKQADVAPSEAFASPRYCPTVILWMDTLGLQRHALSLEG